MHERTPEPTTALKYIQGILLQPTFAQNMTDEAPTTDPRSFLDACALGSFHKQVDFISGPSSVVQIRCVNNESIIPKRIGITLWGEHHGQANACKPCNPGERCWYLPALLQHCDRPIVVMAEADLQSTYPHGSSIHESMLRYMQNMFTEQNRFTGEVGSYVILNRRKIAHGVALAGRNRTIVGGRNVSYYACDMRLVPLQPEQWERLWNRFPWHMDLFERGLGIDPAEGPAVFDTIVRPTHGEDYRSFLLAFARVALEWLPPDHVRRLVASVLRNAGGYAELQLRLLNEGYSEERLAGYLLAAFAPLMDIHMVANLEQQLMLRSPPNTIHMVMGNAHMPTVLQAVRDLAETHQMMFDVTTAITNKDELSPFSCLNVRRMEFVDTEHTPYSSFPVPETNFEINNHTLTVISSSTHDASRDPGDAQLDIVVSWVETEDNRSDGGVVYNLPGLRIGFNDPPLAQPGAPNVIDVEHYGRLAPILAVARIPRRDFDIRPWAPQSDENIRLVYEMLRIDFGELTLDEVVDLAMRILDRAIPPEHRHPDIERIVRAAYEVSNWTVQNYSSIKQETHHTISVIKKCAAAAHKILAPVLSVTAALIVFEELSFQNVRIWIDVQHKDAFQEAMMSFIDPRRMPRNQARVGGLPTVINHTTTQNTPRKVAHSVVAFGDHEVSVVLHEEAARAERPPGVGSLRVTRLATWQWDFRAVLNARLGPLQQLVSIAHRQEMPDVIAAQLRDIDPSHVTEEQMTTFATAFLTIIGRDRRPRYHFGLLVQAAYAAADWKPTADEVAAAFGDLFEMRDIAKRMVAPIEAVRAAIEAAEYHGGVWLIVDRPDLLPTLAVLRLLAAGGLEDDDPPNRGVRRRLNEAVDAVVRYVYPRR